MERLDGVDLFELLAESRQRMREGEKLKWTSPDLALHICRELLRALSYLHKNGMIHKDLKLENVILHAPSKEGNLPTDQSVVLVDFDTMENWTPTSPKAKDVLGTDQYIAPEAYIGNYSPKSDVFAVGVIIYKVLTGFYPFDERIFIDEAGENFVGNPKMSIIRESIRNFKINWNLEPLTKFPDATDLLKKMLLFDENERISVYQALNHPWMIQAIEREDTMSPTHSMRRKSFDLIGLSV